MLSECYNKVIFDQELSWEVTGLSPSDALDKPRPVYVPLLEAGSVAPAPLMLPVSPGKTMGFLPI